MKRSEQEKLKKPQKPHGGNAKKFPKGLPKKWEGFKIPKIPVKERVGGRKRKRDEEEEDVDEEFEDRRKMKSVVSKLGGKNDKQGEGNKRSRGKNSKDDDKNDDKKDNRADKKDSARISRFKDLELDAVEEEEEDGDETPEILGGACHEQQAWKKAELAKLKDGYDIFGKQVQDAEKKADRALGIRGRYWANKEKEEDDEDARRGATASKRK